MRHELLILSALGLSACFPADLDPGVGVDTDVDTDLGGDTDLGIPPELCDALPLPVDGTVVPGFPLNSDFAFDAAGQIVFRDFLELTAFTRDGVEQVILAGNTYVNALATLPNGHLVAFFPDLPQGYVADVDPATATVTNLVPATHVHGLDVGTDGRIYVPDGATIASYDPVTGVTTPIAQDLPLVYDVALSADESVLYVTHLREGTIHALDRLGPDTWDTPRVFWQRPAVPSKLDFGSGPIEVDACDNVYFAERNYLWRLDPTGLQLESVAVLPGIDTLQMHWGNGQGGWAADTLYLSLNGHDAAHYLYEVDVDVPGVP